MAIVRAATEEDIPRILELYRQLSLTPREAEDQDSSSSDAYRRAFGDDDVCLEWTEQLHEQRAEPVGEPCSSWYVHLDGYRCERVHG